MTDPRRRLQDLITAIQAGGPSGRALVDLVEAQGLCGELVAAGGTGLRPLLAQLTSALAGSLRSAGRRAEALDAARESVDLRRQLAARNREAFLPELAAGLNSLGVMLSEVGRRADALDASREAADLYHELAAGNRAAFLADLAMSLSNLGNRLGEVGRPAEALEAAREAAALDRELAAGNREAFLPGLAGSLSNLTVTLSEAGRRAEALDAAREAADLYRELAVGSREAFLPDLAGSLNNLGNMLGEVGRRAEALDAVREAAELYRGLAAGNREAFLPDWARSLMNLGTQLGKAGRRAEALDATGEAADLYRELVAGNREAFLPDWARSLMNLGNRLKEAGRIVEALDTSSEAVDLYRELDAANRPAFMPELAKSQSNLSDRLGDAGRHAEALDAAREAANLYRELATENREAFLPDLATSLANLGNSLGGMGRRAEALDAAREAVELYRELAAGNREAFLPDLASSLGNLGNALGQEGSHVDALDATREAQELYRELAAGNREAFLPDLAGSLNNLCGRLSEVGRRADALDAAREAADLNRELTAGNHEAFLPGLARSLNNLGAMHSKVGRHSEALDATREASDLHRELAAGNRKAFLPDLARSLNNLGVMLSEVDRGADALDAAIESGDLYRELVAGNREAFLPDLAASMSNLGNRLHHACRSAEAVDATREAADMYRKLAAGNREAFLPNLAGSLNNLGIRLSEVGRRAEALQDWRECAALVIEIPPANPHDWVELARVPTRNLDTAQDLHDWHLPLLRLLTEHRELAFDAEHATLFLDLQGLAAARTWALLGTLQAGDAALFDEAVAVLVATLHSPDLARWLQARDAKDGEMTELARLKQDVINAEQLLDSLMKRLGDGASGGGRSGVADPAERAELTRRVDELALKAREHREAFRTERERLIEADPKFRSAFGLPDMPALREAARHGQGAAMLCLLELPVEDSSEPLTVGALIHTDERPTQQLAFEELHATARGLVLFEPYANLPGRGGLLRRSDAATRANPAPHAGGLESPAADAGSTILQALQQQMQQRFWGVLQQALSGAGDGAVQRLHVCGHGLLQQLPLGLRAPADCPGLQLMAWPGLPYLRLASETAPAAVHTMAATSAAAPWLIGHDCAWRSDRPLPMVAVEAALLRLLLEEHGYPVTVIERATQLHAGSAALVLCCHGAQADTNFDGALALGDPPLTVGQVVQGRLGPPLALLPACYAGETREAAGNALGVSAGFLFGGSRVVLASSKSVLDMLAPWLSTLTVWHVLHERSLHDAAITARQEFGTLKFPPAFKEWLTKALPQALATIQPGGVEYERADQQNAADLLALDAVSRNWPWAGDALGLMANDAERREQATASVAHNVLAPRPAKAQELPRMLSEMAAFVFVYGVG